MQSLGVWVSLDLLDYIGLFLGNKRDFTKQVKPIICLCSFSPTSSSSSSTSSASSSSTKSRNRQLSHTPTTIMARHNPVPKAESKKSALTPVRRKQGINFRRQQEDAAIPDRKQGKKKMGKKKRRQPATRQKARTKAEKPEHPLAIAFSCKRSNSSFHHFGI